MEKAMGNQLANVEKDLIVCITPPIYIYIIFFWGGDFVNAVFCFDLT